MGYSIEHSQIEFLVLDSSIPVNGSVMGAVPYWIVPKLHMKAMWTFDPSP